MAAKEKGAFELSKYQVQSGPKVVKLEIEETGDEFEVTVKQLPWARRNQLISQCVSWDGGGSTSFGGDTYVRECLKEMILDAPWGKTSELFLMSIDDRLGGLLETVVPQAFGTEEIGDLDTLKEG